MADSRIVGPAQWTPKAGYEYVEDERYSEQRIDSLNALCYLLDDLKECWQYVEPVIDNAKTYSHKFYELLVRASIEFESNAKGILLSNGYKDRNLSIKDYEKLEEVLKLSAFQIRFTQLRGPMGTMRPFSDWEQPRVNLKWYQTYNEIKHNRAASFQLATLEVVLSAISGLVSILAAQYATDVFQHVGPRSVLVRKGDWYACPGVEFEVLFPVWNDSESYLFDWDKWSGTGAPFRKHPVIDQCV